MKNELAQKITSRRVKDYSYVIVFFLIFSFFILFAIRPNLETAFGLQKELSELKKLNQNYEDAILHIINVQTILEKYRQQVPLLSDALPSNPQVNKVVDDLHIAASSSGLLLKRVDINEVNLKEIEEKQLRKFDVALQTTSDFETVKNFFTNLNSQRRLKMIDTLRIRQDSISTSGAELKIEFELSGYYL